jgi:hypothetical protein
LPSPKFLKHSTFRGSEVFSQQLKQKRERERKRESNQKPFSSGRQKALVFPKTDQLFLTLTKDSLAEKEI